MVYTPDISKLTDRKQERKIFMLNIKGPMYDLDVLCPMTSDEDLPIPVKQYKSAEIHTIQKESSQISYLHTTSLTLVTSV